jgi:Asp-tRNA(Asn)/Glu-tRNA(Gln) amidotransferase C subunit
MQKAAHDASLRGRSSWPLLVKRFYTSPKLARLELGDSEIDRMQKDLGNILEYVNSLAELGYGIGRRRPHRWQCSARRSAPDTVEPSLANEVALAKRRAAPVEGSPSRRSSTNE